MDNLNRLSEMLDYRTISILRACVMTSGLGNKEKRELISKLEKVEEVLEDED